jgi:hypothetical protein
MAAYEKQIENLLIGNIDAVLPHRLRSAAEVHA